MINHTIKTLTMKKIITTLTLLITLGLAPAEALAARLYMTGLEWQSMATEENNGSTATISTTIKNGGLASAQLSSIAAANSKSFTHITSATSSPQMYVRFYVYVDALQASANTYVGARFNGASNFGFVKLYDSAGTLALDVFDSKGGTQITDTASVTYDTWHMIEMYSKTDNVAGSDIFTVRVDGTQVATASNLNFASNLNELQISVFNDGGATDSTSFVYVDDIAYNNTTGAAQNSWPGAGKITLALPNAAGFSACNGGLFSAINEVPPSNNSTGISDRCELTTNGGITGMFNVTNSATLGIDSFDTVSVVAPLSRMIKAASGAANHFMVISANGSATTTGTSVEVPFASGVLTNSDGTAGFRNYLFSYTNPATSLAWTPTGTNSIDSMQIGVGTTDANPDVYVTTLAAMIEYRDVYVPVSATSLMLGKLILMNGKMIII